MIPNAKLTDFDRVLARMRRAIAAAGPIDYDAAAKVLGAASRPEALSIDLVINQAREAPPDSVAVDASASRLLTAPDPLASLDALLTRGLPTIACLQIAGRVLREIASAHPLASAERLDAASVLPAFDARLREGAIELHALEPVNDLTARHTALLLDYRSPSRRWVLAQVRGSEGRVVRLELLLGVIEGEAVPLEAAALAAALVRPPAPSNHAIIEVERPMLPPAIAVFLPEAAEDLKARASAAAATRA